MDEFERKQLRRDARKMFFENEKRGVPSRFRFPDELETALAKYEKAGYAFNVVDRLIIPLLQLDEPAEPFLALSEGLCARPSIAMDNFIKREKRRSYEYPKLTQNGEMRLDIIRHQTANRKANTKDMKSDSALYKKTLEHCLSSLMALDILPRTVGEAFAQGFCRNPDYLNDMILPLNPLYAILDGGLADILSDKPISATTWLDAIELGISLCHYTDEDIVHAARIEDYTIFTDLLVQGWPSIVCIGLLIHTIRLFSSEAHMKLLYQENFAPGEDAAERKELRRQIDQLTGERNAANRKIADLQNQLKTQIALKNQRSQKDTDTSELVHNHNLALKAKDEEIAQLNKRIQQLETERAVQEHKAMVEAESVMQEKPWLDMELPEDGILFIGGHPNMVKKVRELHPKWVFIDAREYNPTLPAKVDVIFIWSAHLSHPLWYQINDAYQSRESMLYVQATNIPRLEEEMKYELWKYLND